MAAPAPGVGLSRRLKGMTPGGNSEMLRCRRVGLRRRDQALLACMALAVFVGVGPPAVHAQDSWDGTIEVRGGPLTVKAGESVTYEIRLSKEPTGDGWWVRIFADGEVRAGGEYKGLSWVPSVGWEFDRNNWDRWRKVSVYGEDDAELNTQVTLTHELWDHNSECPVHNVGPVTVRVDAVSTSPDDGGNGNEDNGNTRNDGNVNDGNSGNDGNGNDGNDPELPTLAIDSVTVSEGGGSAVLSVRLSGRNTGTATVRYATADGTAEAGSDYAATDGTLAFGAGDTVKTIEVALLDDGEAEPTEAFTMELSNAQNATLLNAVGTSTIVDDDGTGQPSDLPALSINDVTVSEGGGSAVFRVTLSGQTTATVSVAYGTSNGTASAGSDYTARHGNLVFLPGQREQMIAVTVNDDTLPEGNETFMMSLTNPQNATLLNGAGTATIVDDDGAGLPLLSIHGVTVSEGGGSAVFKVSMNKRSADVVTVAYATSDGTATARSDYTATSGALTFEPGRTRHALAVPVLDDTEVEGTETFSVRLSGARNATLGSPEATGTIRDDDGDEPPSGPSLAIDDVTVAEDAGSAVFTVSLRPQSDDVVTVAYGTSDWTATAGSDYTAISGTLSFAPGQTRKAITVRILDDGEEEGSEVFTVRLSDARNAVLADPEGTATIIDDEYSGPETMARETTEWIGHFGRTAATQVVDAIDERIRCARDRRAEEGTVDHPSPRWRCTRSTIGVAQGSPLEGSSAGQRDAPGWSAWGRGSFSRFDIHRDDAQILGGGVGNATVGADVAAGQMLLGIALSHSRGGGTVTLDDVAAEVASALTGFHPYLRLGVNDWLSLWGTVGIGTGGLTLTVDDDESRDTGIALRMASVGGLAQVLSPADAHRLSLSVKADGLILAIDADASASFAAASMDASRVRLVVEGAYEFVLGDGHWIAPFADIGGRLDGGGLGTGWGVEIGGGIRYAHPARHLTAELHTRALPVHATEGFSMWSLSGSVRYDPSAGSKLGPYFTLSSSRGQVDAGPQASAGIGAIARPLPVGGAVPGWDVDTELGYGFPVLGGSATGTPWAGVSMSGGIPEYRLGYRMGFGSDLRLGLAGTLRDNGTETEPPDYQVTLTLSTS